MTTPPPAAGNLPLPRWAYVPGESQQAAADYETLAQITVLVPPRFGGYVPARHPALRYGLTLNDRGYFWEAQEVLEAVWAAAPQGGRERILLRACILIANANLRLRMQKPHVTARLLGAAEALRLRGAVATDPQAEGEASALNHAHPMASWVATKELHCTNKTGGSLELLGGQHSQGVPHQCIGAVSTWTDCAAD
jgi:hypothetical protein